MEETQRGKLLEEREFFYGSGENKCRFFKKGDPKIQGRALVE